MMRTDMYYILKDLGVSSTVLANLDEDMDYKRQVNTCSEGMYRRRNRDLPSRYEEEDPAFAA